MKGSRRHQTISSTPRRGRRKNYDKQHWNWTGSRRPEMVGKKFGSLEIVSLLTERDPQGYVRMKTQCVKCGRIAWKALAKLKRGLRCGPCASYKALKLRRGENHSRWAGSTQDGLEGKRIGLLVVISSRLRRIGNNIAIKCKCTRCGKVQWKLKGNLKSVKVGCRSCAYTKYDKPYHRRLAARYTAIDQRCNNPKYPSYKDYGARGILCFFKSRFEFVKWVEKNLPHKDYKGIVIDRIDNDGHYESGNLRLATYRISNTNKRNTLFVTFAGKRMLVDEFDSPYTLTWTWRMIKSGMTGEQIIQSAMERTKKGHRSKTWRHILKWLDSHGYTIS